MFAVRSLTPLYGRLACSLYQSKALYCVCTVVCIEIGVNEFEYYLKNEINLSLQHVIHCICCKEKLHFILNSSRLKLKHALLSMNFQVLSNTKNVITNLLK